MRKPTPPGLNVKETDQTKVSEWKRRWCFASDRRRIPPCRCFARPALPPRGCQDRDQVGDATCSVEQGETKVW
jgi:hypothetical protein